MGEGQRGLAALVQVLQYWSAVAVGEVPTEETGLSCARHALRCRV